MDEFDKKIKIVLTLRDLKIGSVIKIKTAKNDTQKSEYGIVVEDGYQEISQLEAEKILLD